MKFIIIEGPDCSGKSTLAKHAAQQLNACYIHSSGAKPLHTGMLDYHKSQLSNAAVNLEQGRNVVMDRFWPSEYCYGQVLRPHISDRIYDFVEILTLTAKLKPVYVFCDDVDVVLRHEANKDSSHSYSQGQFQRIVDEYRKLTEEMWDVPALPNFHHPRTPHAEMCFDVRRYDVTVNGATMGTFVDSL